MSVREQDLSAGVAVEGAADHFMGRPFDANPYVKQNARDCWEAWRFGWLEASALRAMRADGESARWLRERAA